MVTIWTVFVILALLLMDVLDLTLYGVLIPAAAIILGTTVRPGRTVQAERRKALDTTDFFVIGIFYVIVVALLRLAFAVFTPERVTGMFLAYAGALLLGVVGPVIYTAWVRRRPLDTLGLGVGRWRRTLVLALVFAGVQFSITLWGIRLPEAVDWVPLLVMAVTVGFFEAVFFRGFIQGRLESAFGPGPAVLGAAVLYSLYHFGYGMGGEEMVFLFGLGVVYAIAYRLADSILVLWPLLTPLGSFFSQLQAGDLRGQLPWASIAGFADVLVVMAVVIWLGYRAMRPRARSTALPAAQAR